MKIRKRILVIIGFIILLAAGLGAFAWYKLLRDVPQAPIENDEEWFKYGSLGGENEQGIPYWIWVVAPRIFPDLIKQAGGYRAFGVAWEPGRELPVGFVKRTVGFPRVGNNCAMCHTATWRENADSNPHFVTGAPAHTLNIGRMLRFFVAAAGDARFDADVFLNEISRETKLSFADELLYRFLIIPLTRKAFLEQGKILKFADSQSEWGPGRDDSFNLPKYFFAKMPDDHTAGIAEFGTVWRLRERRGAGLYFNWSGETPELYSVLVDSALGVGARPGARFDADMKRLEKFLTQMPSPHFPEQSSGPYSIQKPLAEAGKIIYNNQCAACHEPGNAQFGHVIPLSEIGTDPERAKVWTAEAASKVNDAINNKIGARRPDLVKVPDGYLAGPLDGIWIRAPYLHNGSVPTLRDLLNPEESRPVEFERGCDIYDPVNVGFISKNIPDGEPSFRLDTRLRSNGNRGHLYGTRLAEPDKLALLEYLKTK